MARQGPGAGETLKVGGHTITVSSPGKVLFDTGITKRDLVAYYVSVAPAMLPLMRDRPVVHDALSGRHRRRANCSEKYS